MKPHLVLDDAYPEVLADIAREIHMHLMSHPLIKLDHPNAAEIALNVAEHVRAHIGGAAIYIPRGLDYERASRDRQIYEAFNGRNYGELARQYGMTEMRVRQIITHVGRIEKAKRQ